MSEPLVLVVDDEEQIALCATMFLKRAGYRTLQAASREQALHIFNDEVDVLLTDCTMSGLPGYKLAAILLARKPTLRALFMSGNVVESIPSDIPLEPGVNFIQKPFSSAQLVAFVIQAFVEKPVATR